MKYFLLLLMIVLSGCHDISTRYSLSASTKACNVDDTPYDVIQLDSGNTNIHYGKHVLDYVPGIQPWHGTSMGNLLVNQLEQLGTSNTINGGIFSGYGEYDNMESYLYYLDCIVNHRKFKVLSFSGGGTDSNHTEETILKSLGNRIMTAAAGNHGESEYYPGSYYHIPCVIKVGATKNHNIIYKTKAEVYVEQQEGDLGTSASTARFGAVALDYWRKNPKLTCVEVETKLKEVYGKP